MLYVYVLVSGIRDSAYAYVCTVGASAHMHVYPRKFIFLRIS